MSFWSNRKIKVAAETKSKHNLSSRVITSNDFGVILPIFCRETVPGDSWSFDISSMARLAPMPVPTYAGMKIVNRLFYVRMRSIWKPFDDFYTGRKHSDGKVYSIVPTVTNRQLVYLFAEDSDLRTQVASGSDIPSIVFDFSFYDEDADEIYYYNFTTIGRRFYSLLRNLGYNINWTISDQTQMSLLPLLAYFRVFYDYYLPSKYTNDNSLRFMFEQKSWDTTTVTQTLEEVKKVLFIYFDNDYFTSSWTSPVSPDSSVPENFVSVEDYMSNLGTDYEINVQSENKIAHNTKYGSILVNDNGDNTLYGISQFGIDALKRLYDWGMRKNLAGNRYFESIFAQFGIKLPDVQVDRSMFLGSDISPIQVSDVMSTASTEVNGQISPLGAYAGKGISYNNGDRLACDCNDFGYIICLTQIIPDTGYVQGRSRELQHLKPTDFFQPEFDCLGMQGIRNDELFAEFSRETYNQGQNYGGKPNGIFGYVPRLSEYKVGRDILSGDFAIRHLNEGLDSYHSFRIFENPSVNYPLNNTQEFRILDPALNGNNFNRIFNVTDDTADHFICVYNINAIAERKMKSIQNAFELDGGDIVDVNPDNMLNH